ncbi:hypothetical protein PMAYCL1PPCAC_14387, partial [Pristionchus mayeri]
TMTRATPGRTATVADPTPMRERTPTRSTVAKELAYTPIKDVNLKLRLARATSETGEETWRARSMKTPRTEGRPPARVATIAKRDKDYEPEDVDMESSGSEEGEESSSDSESEPEEEEETRRTRQRGSRAAASRSVSRARGAAAAGKGRSAATGFRLEMDEDDDRLDLSKAPSNLAAALDRLAVYRCPRGTLLCRERECAAIKEFIKAAVAPTGISSACYISGVPGTGKTASVLSMLNEVASSARSRFVFIKCNAMYFSDPKMVFTEILAEYERQSGVEKVKRIAGTQARKKLNTMFERVDSSRLPVLILVDELDQLSTKKQELIYDVFNWSSVEAARVSIISIANTLDLPERMLNQRICSRLGMNRIVFQPYSHEEIVQIVMSKLGGISTTSKKTSPSKGGRMREEESIIEDKSIEIAARKVAAISGDLRKAMDILRAAIEAAIRKGEKKLTFEQVKDAISAASETLLVLAVRSLAAHQKMIFEAAVDIVRTRDVLDFSMGELIEKYELIARIANHIDPINYDGVCRIVLQLCSMGLVKFVNPNEPARFRRRLRLLPAVHDASSALKIVDQKQKEGGATARAWTSMSSTDSSSDTSMRGVMERVRARLSTRLYGVDEQLKSLGDLMSAVRGGKGGSVIVYGQEESGRSAVIDRALEQHANGVHTQHLWLSRLGTETNALQTLLDSEASKEPRIIVVDSADDLVCKSKQALLYRLLDRAKTGPWLVLLIITNQDMISSLEKRVRSRLPNARVFTGEAIGEEEWSRLFEALLTEEKRKEEGKKVAAKSKSKKGKETKSEEGKDENGAKWAEFVNRFLADEKVQRLVLRLYEYSGQLAVAKRVLNTWLMVLNASDVEEAMNPVADVVHSQSSFRHAIDDFCRAVEMTVPLREEMKMKISDLTHRSFCVLAAAARRIRCNPTGTFAYGKIAIDFIHQCNHVDRRMLPDSELQTFKELDRLCDSGLLAAVGPATQAHSYRQIALNCPLLLLLTHIREHCRNAVALKEWFESQPVS